MARMIRKKGAPLPKMKSHDSAGRLLKDIRAKRIDPKALTVKQRKACLLVMSNGKMTSPEMADLFGVAPSTIRREMMEIRQELGREVEEWDLAAVLGQLALAKDRCAAEAMKNADPGLAWTVERDFAKILKDLGVIGVKETGSGVRMTIEAIGDGVERATALLRGHLDPSVTGVMVEQIKDQHPPMRELPRDEDMSPDS